MSSTIWEASGSQRVGFPGDEGGLAHPRTESQAHLQGRRVWVQRPPVGMLQREGGQKTLGQWGVWSRNQYLEFLFNHLRIFCPLFFRESRREGKRGAGVGGRTCNPSTCP